MNEAENLINERKDRLINFFKKDIGFSALVIGGVLSLLFGFISSAGAGIVFTSFGWFFLGIMLLASSGLYYQVKLRKYFALPILAWIVWLSWYIRTLNLPGLKDITTNSWALGPDLDPWLFLRWAKHIIANGSIMAIDTMRYVPLGYETSGELLGTPYFIAWFYKLTAIGGWTESVTHAAVLYPVVMFALTVIVFFFLARKFLGEELGELGSNVAAIIASFFLVVLPSLLPRTIAGIPEKESGAFLFMFLAFYFFLSAWKTKSIGKACVFAILAGLATGAMGLTWGGVTFLYLIIGPAVFVSFMLGKVQKRELITYGLWLLGSFALMYPFSSRYSIKELVSSIDSGAATAIFCIMIVHYLIFNTGLKNRVPSKFKHVPPQVISLVVGGVLLVVVSSVLFGIGFIPAKIQNILVNLITPSSNRLLLTVAENKQPYFTEWAGNFGPHFRNIPVIFWLFFFGSIYFFYRATRSLIKKDRWVFAASYFVFLISLIFSRYSAESTLNGTNFLSKFIYGFGFVVFVGCAGYYLYKYYKKGEEGLLHQVNFSFILMFTFFLMSVIAARAAVRTVMVLDPPVAILVGYLVVVLFQDARRMNSGFARLSTGCIAVLVIFLIMFAGVSLYKGVEAGAAGYYPSAYNQQWQKAMAWVRDSTPANAVFGHWWDYGYWIQSIGERATVLDGGNAISYWNHLMGRHALTGPSESAALEFLYAHNTTYFLIDSSDIGKYPAYASIGSDADYDRVSSIASFYRDPQQVQEKKNSTLSLYTGGVGLDEDIIYDDNGTRIFLPSGGAALGGVLLERDSDGNIVAQPQGVFIYNNKQYSIPLRYVYEQGKTSVFEGGIDAGVFIYPRAFQDAAGVQIDNDGALLYLSKRTIHSQFARLYLLNEESGNFRLEHSEDDFLISQVKQQNPGFGDFLDYGGVRGPIKIWSIHYPENITFNPEYLSTYYPPELIRAR